MRIALYAPLKAPYHPVPSGDRQMARLLIAALRLAGYEVEIASTLRAYLPEPSASALSNLKAKASAEIARIERDWQTSGRPDLWLAYHPYYKAPDLIGPALCERLGIPYITVEASHAGKRDAEGWAPSQGKVIDAVKMAAVNLCFTARDREGLAKAMPDAVLADLKPFIDTGPYTDEPRHRPDHRLVTVAMMRRGDKLKSFTKLAAALDLLTDIPWHLTIIGDGPARGEVRERFQHFAPQRIAWAGEITAEKVAEFLYGADLYVWPGCGEAYGLAYLEAQAAGLPVVAQNTAGVPEVVRDGETGILTPEDDTAAYAGAIRALLGDDKARGRMAAAARNFVLTQRSLSIASMRLGSILTQSLSR